jgi:hypothetical protein
MAHSCVGVPQHQALQAAPRQELHVLQPGDTLASVARQHQLPLGTLLAANPELALEPGLVQPGALLALPNRSIQRAPSPPPPSPTGRQEPQPRSHWRVQRQYRAALADQQQGQQHRHQQQQHRQQQQQHQQQRSVLAAQQSSNGSSSRLSSASLRMRSAALAAHSTPLPRGARVERWLSAAAEPAWLRQHLQADAAAAGRDQQAIGPAVAAWAAAGPEAASQPLLLPRPRRHGSSRRIERSAMSAALPKVLLD